MTRFCPRSTFLAAASLFASLAFMSTGASALPLAPPMPAMPDMIVQIAGGCGPGWHRGPYGGCRRNFANPRAHACPRGFHIGPGGRCRGNWR